MSELLYQVSPSMIKGLTPEENTIFNELLRVWQRHLPGNQRKERYYEQKNKLKDLGISIPPQLKTVDTVLGWPQKAVDSLAERSVFQGFTTGGSLHPELAEIVDDNDFETIYDQGVTSELTHSFSVLTLSKGLEGEPDVILSAYSAVESAILWDYRRKRIKAGIVVVDVKDDGSGRAKPTWVNLYTDRYTVTCRKMGNGRWIAERQENNLGRPMMEALVFLPSIKRPFGQSRITRAVRSIADSATREALRTELAAEFYTAPQKYALGIDPDTFGKTAEERQAKKLKAYLGTIMAFTPNKNGDVPSVGQFPQMSMQPHTEYMQQLAKEFAGETGIPVNSLGIVQDNPSSAEAIYAATGDLIVKAEKLNRQNGRALHNIAVMALCARRNVTKDSLSVEERSVRAEFADETRPSKASRADFAIKVASAVPAYSGTAQFWRDLGYGERETQEVMTEIRRQQAQAAIAAQLASNLQQKEVDNGDGYIEAEA